MPKDVVGTDDSGVLQSKRNATRYQILVQVAEHQPAVSQQEIADAIGITAQAVSDYLRDLIEQEYVDKHGRGRYEITKEGVDWLITQTDELRGFIKHVAEDVIGQVDIETALARTEIDEGETVTVTMKNGVLRAMAGDVGGTTAVAVTDAAPEQDVGVTNFEGVLDYDLGTVTIVAVPTVQNGGSAAVDPDEIHPIEDEHDLVAVAGTEAFATARRLDIDPGIRYGTQDAVEEAATKGQSVLLLATTDQLSTHTDRLREGNIGYEVVDVREE